MQRLTEKELKDRTTRQMEQHIEANHLKTFLELHGYRFTMSLYGVLYNPETLKPEYRRIEVFMLKLPSAEDVGIIKHFFRDVKPYPYYSIWVYNNILKEIGLIDSWT